MSRMRPATRSGWKASSASSFSPTPRNLIGAPVTARMESAAPPRASPSARVSTMPESVTRSLKLLAILTASWPVRLSATSSVSCGLTWSRTRATSLISSSSMCWRPGGVEDQHVVAADLGRGHGALGDIERGLAGDDRQRRHAGLFAENLQLLHRGGAVHVERGHQHALLLARLQELAELGRGGGLARALQADHQDRRGRRAEIEAGVGVAQRFDQRVVDDLDHLLAGRDRADDAFADGARAHAVDEVLDHRQRHIGFEQRDADFAQRLVDVGLRQRAAAAQAVEGGGEALLQTVEHSESAYPHPSYARHAGDASLSSPADGHPGQAGPAAREAKGTNAPGGAPALPGGRVKPEPATGRSIWSGRESNCEVDLTSGKTSLYAVRSVDADRAKLAIRGQSALLIR